MPSKLSGETTDDDGDEDGQDQVEGEGGQRSAEKNRLRGDQGTKEATGDEKRTSTQTLR